LDKQNLPWRTVFSKCTPETWPALSFVSWKSFGLRKKTKRSSRWFKLVCLGLDLAALDSNSWTLLCIRLLLSSSFAKWQHEHRYKIPSVKKNRHFLNLDKKKKNLENIRYLGNPSILRFGVKMIETVIKELKVDSSYTSSAGVKSRSDSWMKTSTLWIPVK